MLGSRVKSLDHGWDVTSYGVSAEIMADFVQPALSAVPSSMARPLGPCRFVLRPLPEEPDVASRWRKAGGVLEVCVATGETEPHDLVLEILLCLGQSLWEVLEDHQVRGFLEILAGEIGAGVAGEIDELALECKRRLHSKATMRSRRRLMEYAGVSFAATAAEYVHCLWHDVTVREGRDHLPPDCLRRRLDLLAGWFPPDPGYRLYPAQGSP